MIRKKKKTSWDYQKEKNYRRVPLNFNMDDEIDALIYHYLEQYKPNRTSYIKRLVYEDMVRCVDHE